MVSRLFAYCVLLILATSIFHVSACDNKDGLFLDEDLDTGFIKIDERGSYFYWLFRSRNDPCQAPLLLYLTGGPGCTSESAIFTSNGPYRVNSDRKTLKRNPYAWNQNFNLLFVDQPFGTGFSDSKVLSTTMEQIAADFYIFMVGLLKKYPEYQRRDFYIAGESYAGHYIPAISSYILKKGGLKLNFKGIAIGSGLVDFGIQGPSWAPYSYENELIDPKTKKASFDLLMQCVKEIKESDYQSGFDKCTQGQLLIVGNDPVPAFNLYDIRKKCNPNGPLCYDWSEVDEFLAQEKVIKALGIKGRTFTQCNNAVEQALGFDLFFDYKSDLSFLVRKNLQVLLYYGDKDWIVNWIGGEIMADNLEWRKKEYFSKPRLVEWKNYGEYKSVDSLTFLKVNNAGHFLSMDQPKIALQMIEKFVKGWDS